MVRRTEDEGEEMDDRLGSGGADRIAPHGGGRR